MKRKTIKKQPVAKRRKTEPQPYLQDLANNQGLSHLVNHIFGYLEAQDLAKCRLASRSLKNVVDNNKKWWIAFELWKLKEDVKKKNLRIKELEKQFK